MTEQTSLSRFAPETPTETISRIQRDAKSHIQTEGVGLDA